MTANEELIRELAKVISDPGAVLPRAAIGPYRGEYETVPTWTARAVLASLPRLGATVDTGPSPSDQAVQREDPGWLYNEPSGVLYGPDPDHPGLRYPLVTNVEAAIGHRFAEAMNRAALASPAPAPQGEQHVCPRWCAQHAALGGPLDEVDR